MILVTGGTGFLGSYLLYRLFKDGKKVRALKRPGSSNKQLKLVFGYLNSDANLSFEEYYKSFQWVNADLLHLADLEDAMTGVDEVFHLAAMVSYDKKQREKILRNNIRGTAHLVDLALEKGAKGFHYVSSIASLDRNSENIIKEDNPLDESNKRSAYGLSKYNAELEVWRGYAEGLTGVIVNPGVIIGPGDPTYGSLKIFKTIQDGFRFYPSGCNGYVDARDVVNCLLALSSDEKYFQQRYLLVSENIKYQHLFGMIARNLNLPEPNISVPGFAGNLVYRLDYLKALLTGKSPILTKELVGIVYQNYLYDNTRIKEALGYQFMPVEESVKDTCGFMKSMSEKTN